MVSSEASAACRPDDIQSLPIQRVNLFLPADPLVKALAALLADPAALDHLLHKRRHAEAIAERSLTTAP